MQPKMWFGLPMPWDGLGVPAAAGQPGQKDMSNRRLGLASQSLGMAWVFQPLLVNPEKDKVSNRQRSLASQSLGMAWAFQLLLVNPDRDTTSNRQGGSTSQRLEMAWVFQLLLVNPDKDKRPTDDAVWPPNALGGPGRSSRCWSTRIRTNVQPKTRFGLPKPWDGLGVPAAAGQPG